MDSIYGVCKRKTVKSRFRRGCATRQIREILTSALLNPARRAKDKGVNASAGSATPARRKSSARARSPGPAGPGDVAHSIWGQAQKGELSAERGLSEAVPRRNLFLSFRRSAQFSEQIVGDLPPPSGASSRRRNPRSFMPHPFLQLHPPEIILRRRHDLR